MNLMKIALPVVVLLAAGVSVADAAVVFFESLGTVSSAKAISSHESSDGFDNNELTFSGTGDVRATSTSSGYVGASGSANVYLTSNSTSNFRIDGISTMGYDAGTVGISFGAWKSAIASDMATLVLEFSTDGLAWTGIPIPAQETGSGTAVWRLLSFDNTSIPISETLSLRWTNTDSSTAYRLDDITLSAVPEPSAAVLGSLGLLALLRRRR